MEVARSEHPAVALDGEVVVIGGLISAAPGRISATASVEAYDPVAATWRRLPDLPQPRHHLMAAVLEGRLFALGGYAESGFDAIDTVWELVDGTWQDRVPLPEPVGAGAAVALDGHIYVVGGTPDGGLHRYDPVGEAWESLASPLQRREHVAAVGFESQLWLLAGRWQGAFPTTTELYDVASDSWAPGPSLNEARSGFGATVISDAIWVAGGEVFDPDTSLASVETLREGRWTRGDDLPVGLHGNPLVAVVDTVYLPGGSVRAGGVDNPGALYALPSR